MKIISASRRTDIPAFYSEWFMNRIRAGYVRWQNPFSGVPYQVSLRPEDVSAIVFWSKNYLPLLPYLDELDRLGYRMVFHFTITGLPRPFEPNVPELPDLLESARHLADRCGPEAVLWRYDPVLVSSLTSVQYHLSRFKEIAGGMEGLTRRCHFSFPIFYDKVLRNMGKLSGETGIACYDLPKDDCIELSLQMADIGANHGIEMYSCCGDYLVAGKIKKAHCVDAELLGRLFPDRIGSIPKRPTRKQCGCFESTDIGAYNTCPHACVYCYANANKGVALWVRTHHDPASDMLAGGARTNAERQAW